MTVDVTDDELNWRFAGGQGYTIARAEIDRVRTVPHRWWAGYGIKYFGPKRWTYVIGGCNTVEVSLKSGRLAAVGHRRSARSSCRAAATRVELIINRKTAKALGLTVLLSLLGRTDGGKAPLSRPTEREDPTLAACYRSSIRHPRTGGR